MPFTEGRGLWFLVQFDVSAQRQPPIELAMVDEQNSAALNDENRHCEINLLVNMRHTPIPKAL